MTTVTIPQTSAGPTLAELDSLIAQVDAIRSQARTDSRYGFDEPWEVFARHMRLLTPQSYGLRVEAWLTEKFGWTSVPSSEGRGDIVDKQGNYWEMKVTFITGTNERANFVQLRPHQDIAGYHLFVIQPNYTRVHLVLTAEEMAHEIQRLGSSAHGTKGAVAANSTREWAIRFPWTPESGIAREWIEKYGQ